MFPSLQLGRWFGIPLFLHWTFWLLPLWVVLSQSGEEATPLKIVFYLVILAAVFSCVVLHELGHALAARYFGIRTRDITLYPIGGVASLQRMSEKPTEELVIAVAGPAVNVVIAGGLFLAFLLGRVVNPTAFTDTLIAEFMIDLIGVNIGMILFNMIPAFPLDGGRVFRALLAMGLGHLQATRVAVRVGTALAIGLPLAVWAFLPQFASPFLVVIAFVLYSSGQQELAFLEHRERLRTLAQTIAPPPFMPPHDVPSWTRPPVTVYVLDPGTGQWVRQGQA